MDATRHWDERLSEYLDGDLGASDARACAEHLSGCVACATLLAELESVTRATRALPATPPAHDLWPAIAVRLDASPAAATPASVTPATRPRVLDVRPPWWRRRLTLSVPQALAASLLLVALAGGASWLAHGTGPSALPLATRPDRTAAVTGAAPGPTSPPGGAAPSPETRMASVATPSMAVASVDPRYDRTVADLQRLFATQRSQLDTSTVRILDQNLAIIDRAVADARRAVDSDPSNEYLRSHLAATMRQKVDLLRRATVIAGTRG